jgi:hypothetical protein
MIPVELNHIYFVVDRETYAAIRESEVVRSLAYCYEQKNSADNRVGWEGFYIRGKNTYIELFYPQERYPETGISGIGMGVDEQGGLEIIAYEVRDFQKGSFKRNGKGWFNYLAVNDSYFAGKNSFWIMEYSRDYFSEDTDDVSRAQYNAERFDPAKPFVDILEFSIALNKDGAQILSSYLEKCGLARNNQSYMTPEQIKIHIVEQNELHKGIYQVRFSLDRDFEKVSYEIGNSTLVLNGEEGVWTFHITE